MKSITPSDFQRTILYEIYIRSFYDSNHDGVGDLSGITQKLDYFAGGSDSLGINTLWLTPFYPSPMADFGYDITDHCAVDPLFGTMADFKDLLKAAHDRELRVLIDFIPNHTSDKHPWFVSSRSSQSDHLRSWYVWKDPQPDGSPPNNWRCITGDSAWQFDKTTNQYYLHSFLPQQPDLNWDNPAVREAMIEIIHFWSNIGVDGFRVDSAEWISKDPTFTNDPIDSQYSVKDDPNPYHALLHRHSKRGPNLYSYLHELARAVHTHPNKLLVLETHPHHWDDTHAYLGFYQSLKQQITAPFNLEALFAAWDANTYKTFIDNFQTALRDAYLPVYVLGNHDSPRLATRIGRPAALTAAMLLLTLPGMPTIYYGDELAMIDEPIPQNKIKDQFELNQPRRGLGRDPERTPMLWNNHAYSGFSTVEPWLPVESDYATYNADAQSKDHGSSLQLYRNLIKLRGQSDAWQSGSYQSLMIDSHVLCFIRQSSDEKFIVSLNFSEEEIKLHHSVLSGTVILSTNPETKLLKINGDLSLQPHEGVIIKVSSP